MTTRAPRFGFGFEARVGKDTAVDYLIKKHGGVRISFASPIYDILEYAQNVCGFEKVKDREFLQQIGTEWARKKDPNVWVNVARRRIEFLPADMPIFISDVRFPNEVEMLKSLGFVLVNITRDPVIRMNAFNSELVQNVGSTTHASETALLGYENLWDCKIHNEGSLEKFYSELDRVFDKFYRQKMSVEERYPRFPISSEVKEAADTLLEESPRTTECLQEENRRLQDIYKSFHPGH